MNTSSDHSISPTPPTKKPSLYPPEPAHNPSIAPPFSKPPSFESMTSTLQPTPSEQDAHHHDTTLPPHQQHRPTLSSEYTSTHPFSAFYSHPTTRTSLEQAKSAAASSKRQANVHVHVYEHEHDLENQSSTLSASASASASAFSDANAAAAAEKTTTPTTTSPKRVSTMWASIPRCAAQLSHSSTRQRSRHNIAGTVRGSRACAPYRRLSRGQRWVVQILLAVVVVGAATALGVGISKAVGAGVWKTGTSTTTPIGGG